MNDFADIKPYLDLPLSAFLSDAGAHQPTPGGGSVSALSGILGVTMGGMAAEYTLNSKKCADHHEAARGLLEQFARAKGLLEQLMRDDMAAYRAYATAAKGRNGSDEEKAQFQTAVAVAIAVPMEMTATAAAALKTMSELKPICNKFLLSDLSVGAHLVRGSANGAAEMVRVNVPDLANRKEAEETTRSLSTMLAHIETLCGQVTGASP